MLIDVLLLIRPFFLGTCIRIFELCNLNLGKYSWCLWPVLDNIGLLKLHPVFNEEFVYFGHLNLTWGNILGAIHLFWTRSEVPLQKHGLLYIRIIASRIRTIFPGSDYDDWNFYLRKCPCHSRMEGFVCFFFIFE